MSAIEPALEAEEWRDWFLVGEDDVFDYGTVDLSRSVAILACPGEDTWEHAVSLPSTVVYDDDGLVAKGPVITIEGRGIVSDLNRHGVAAILLYDQPYGFTHEHADNVLDAATEWPEEHPKHGQLVAVAAIIRALLPPKP